MRKKLWLAHAFWMTLCILAFVSSEWGNRWGLARPLHVSLYPVVKRMDGMMRDLKLRLRGYRAPKQKIVFVDIDDQSLEQFGRWPWRRDVIAHLIQEVFSNGASIVGLDIVFSEKQESIPDELKEILRGQNLGEFVTLFDYDKRLAQTFEKHRERLVVSWMGIVECRPGFDGAEDCPVENPDALALVPEDFSKFALSDVQGQRKSQAQSPLRAAVTLAPPTDQFRKVVSHAGSVNSAPDADGLVRRYTPFLLVGENVYPSLALKMAMLARQEKPSLRLDSKGFVGALRWKESNQPIPTSPLGVWEIGYLGPRNQIRYLSAKDILVQADENPPVRGIAGLSSVREVLEGALVIVGVSATAAGDNVATPFEPIHPGTEVQATVLENLLSDSLISTGPKGTLWILMGCMLVLGFAAVWMGQKWEAVPAMVGGVVLLVATLSLDLGLFFSRNLDFNTGFWYVQLVGSFALTLAGRYIIEQNDRKFVRSAFSKYVAPTVVDSILKDPSQLMLGGRRETLTVLFSDIRGFTSLSEKLGAKQVAEFLNDYLEIQTEIAFAHGGTLDKYIGDAVMAFWGAPLPQTDHAHRACTAALAMAAELEKNRARYQEKYGFVVQMGIGLHTGEVNVGNMGSTRTFSYTVLGDNVNLASRLESATKQFGVEILTSRATLDSVASTGHALPLHRSLAFTRVKGKQQAVEVIELLKRPAVPGHLERYTEGLIAFRSRRFKEALELLLQARKDNPTDISIAHYIAQCEALLKTPPSEDWDGVWDLTEK